MPVQNNALQGFKTSLSVGDILHRARLQKKLSVQDVESAIRISAQHIIAIEEGRLEVLPGRIYALGFVRTYAEYVDLDGDKILELLLQQSGRKVEQKELPPMTTLHLEDVSLPTTKIFLTILLLLIGVIFFKSYSTDDAYLLNEEIPTVPKDLISQTTLLSKPEKVNQETGIDSSVTIDMTAIPTSSNQIVLKAIDNVWIDIRSSDNKTFFSRVLSIGEEYWIPLDKTDMVMTVGNAGGLQIQIDGQILPFMGKKGQVIRKVALDAEKLKQSLKSAPKKAM